MIPSFVKTAKEPHLLQLILVIILLPCMHMHTTKTNNIIILVEFWVTNYLKPTLSFYRDYRNLPAALDEFDPDVVVYNAGTDILEGDQLGNLDITPQVAKLSSPLSCSPSPSFLSHTHFYS